MSIAISNRSLTIGCLGKLLNDFFAFRFARRVFSFESDNTNQNFFAFETIPVITVVDLRQSGCGLTTVDNLRVFQDQLSFTC